VTAVYFSGPTMFAPLINTATGIAAGANCRYSAGIVRELLCAVSVEEL
jgi:hypothetical protein